jgi:hypothetical protein
VVAHAEPPIEGNGVLEYLDLGGIDFDGRHQDTLSWRWTRSSSNSSSSSILDDLRNWLICEAA